MKVTGTEEALGGAEGCGFQNTDSEIRGFSPPSSFRKHFLPFTSPCFLSLASISPKFSFNTSTLASARSYITSCIKTFGNRNINWINKSTQPQLNLIAAFSTLHTNMICELAFARPVKHQTARPPVRQRQFPGAARSAACIPRGHLPQVISALFSSCPGTSYSPEVLIPVNKLS